MTISSESSDRLRHLQSQMAETGVDLTAIGPTPNMRYLLGFTPLADERLCALLVSREATRFVVPMLNADQVEAHTGLTAIRWTDAAGPQQALAEALGGLGAKPDGVLVADDTMRVDALLMLQESIRPKKTKAAVGLMGALRIRKSEAEIEVLARAATQADRAIMVGVEACRPGVTERQVGDAMASYFRKDGAELVDFTIVASGPNGAFPHHHTGDRVLQSGDTVILDIGATLRGYKSDVTRTLYLGDPPAEVRAAYEAVLDANRRGREAARAGARAGDVDRAARGSLEQAGFGPYFLHRTGHGLGLEVHEPPWMTGESDTTLEPGMVFSVEPGVYLQGKFGIRIEDIVVVTEGECRCLTGLDHQLIVKA